MILEHLNFLKARGLTPFKRMLIKANEVNLKQAKRKASYSYALPAEKGDLFTAWCSAIYAINETDNYSVASLRHRMKWVTVRYTLNCYLVIKQYLNMRRRQMMRLS